MGADYDENQVDGGTEGGGVQITINQFCMQSCTQQQEQIRLRNHDNNHWGQRERDHEYCCDTARGE